MQPEVKAALDLLLQNTSPGQGVMTQAIGALMDGRCSPVEIAALLTASACHGETADELAGAAAAMRQRAARIPTSRSGLLDTCGTGGDHLSTFNISTATALVVAAAGVPVAKHGNRKASSSSGSADVLEALGVNIELTAEQAGACLDEMGLCFCYARQIHGAMKHVAPVRTELGFRTIFNLLGPLTNPAGAEFQLLGANRISTAEKLAGALSRLGIRRALVVCGADQLDEVALWGTTTVFEVTGSNVRQINWSVVDWGLATCTPNDLRVDSAAESAACIRAIFNGQHGPQRDIVLANAAAALLCAGRVGDLQQGVALAAQTVDSGSVTAKLAQLVTTTRRLGE